MVAIATEKCQNHSVATPTTLKSSTRQRPD